MSVFVIEFNGFQPPHVFDFSKVKEHIEDAVQFLGKRSEFQGLLVGSDNTVIVVCEKDMDVFEAA